MRCDHCVARCLWLFSVRFSKSFHDFALIISWRDRYFMAWPHIIGRPSLTMCCAARAVLLQSGKVPNSLMAACLSYFNTHKVKSFIFKDLTAVGDLVAAANRALDVPPCREDSSDDAKQGSLRTSSAPQVKCVCVCMRVCVCV